MEVQRFSEPKALEDTEGEKGELDEGEEETGKE